MNNLNYTALFGFLAVVFLVFSHAAYDMVRDKESGKREWDSTIPQLKVASRIYIALAIIFGSLTALTWGN